MPIFGSFDNEDAFNAWLKADGEIPLREELKTLFGLDFKRIQCRGQFFGIPDHTFYTPVKKRLLLIECADILDKKHLCKDMLYLLENISDVPVESKVLFWILGAKPSPQIVQMIEQAHSQMIFRFCTPQFFISTVVSISETSIRLNLENSFGERMVSLYGTKTFADFEGTNTWLSMKGFANIMGLPYTTAFNVAKRWGKASNGISLESLTELVQRLEQHASTVTGINFSGRFVPMHSRADRMLFPTDVNRLLGYKGSSVRVPIRPKWITIAGPANRGYRFLFDKEDIENYKNRSADSAAGGTKRINGSDK